VTFAVSLPQAAGLPLTFDYQTVNGSALAGSDYAPTSGSVTFLPGDTSASVSADVFGDGTLEWDEFFYLSLGGWVLSPATIVNDDALLLVLPQQSFTLDEGTLLSFQAGVAYSDLQVGDVQFLLENGDAGQIPEGASIGFFDGLFTWVPAEEQGPGAYTFDVVATAAPALGVPADRQTVTVTVNEANRPPVVTPVADQLARIGEPLSFAVYAQDADIPDNDLLFSLEGAVPAGAAIDPATGQFSWMPVAGQTGTHVFDVVVADNGVPSLTDRVSPCGRGSICPFSIITTDSMPGQVTVARWVSCLPERRSVTTRRWMARRGRGSITWARAARWCSPRA
jgi:hypothetical protein